MRRVRKQHCKDQWLDGGFPHLLVQIILKIPMTIKMLGGHIQGLKIHNFPQSIQYI